MAVSVSPHPNFSVQGLTRLFQNPTLIHNLAPVACYDASADGRRFLLFEPVGGSGEPSIRVVQNWYEEFRDRKQD